MCGISGIFNLNKKPIESADLEKMNNAIRHRGPDGGRCWSDINFGLAHRRLSIIDLSNNASQPMHSADDRYVITYNGELYNYLELRTELLAKGYIFKSQSDTEVVLNAFICWGNSAFEKFNGMFALAIWDKLKRNLTVARDRYGIKPLYYYTSDQQFVFCSELKGIISLPNFNRKLNRSALSEYLTFQNIFSDGTLLENINVFPPGYYGTISEKRRSLKLQQYWDFDFGDPDFNLSENECIEHIEFLLRSAVKRQMVSDVEIATYLSGGIDSGSITAIASSFAPELKTFTVGFDLSSASGIELGFDERARAEAMSAAFRTEQYEMVLKAGDMEKCMERLVYHVEEPRVGQSYPNFYASKLASKFVKVVLSGTGGDELFGGYPWRYYKTSRSSDFEDFISDYYDYWQRLTTRDEREQLLRSEAADTNAIENREIFQNVFKNTDKKISSEADCVNKALYFEAKTFLRGLLHVEDKLSMAHGLESRVPFLDNDLVDFALRCPPRYKLANLSDNVRIDENSSGSKKRRYYNDFSDGKIILRRSLANIMPKKALEAKKQGFSSPDASWFRGESIDYVKDTLCNRNSKLYDVFDYKTTNAVLDEHLTGQKNRRLLIWSMLYIDNFLQQFEV